MAPLSIKIVLDDGAVTRTVLFDSNHTVKEAHDIVIEKFYNLDRDKEYGLFMTSADDEKSGIWLEDHRTLEFYMLRDGDSLQCLCKKRNMRFRMLDGTLKTLQVDESKVVGDLLFYICNRIGITNHDEYGLCHDETEEVEEVKPATGTLTLKKHKQPSEKDARLEQLSKKLKTDDNVEWLDQKKTLRELQVDPKETLLLKRRLFYSDRKIDARDPVQLNLLYVQTRDNVLSGRQVTTEDKAIEFAGIQCQIHFGDFEEEKHKLGFIENLAEYLPEQYVSSWGIEKKIYREYSKHAGLSQLDAKCLYTKVARELPTYGVTFFLVKEKEKNKKKLVPRLLGINANSILRLDEKTKEILKVWLLTQVKSYNAGKNTFTLNFGDYSDKEYTVKTNEAFRIRDILEGYIDIIRKKQGGPHNVQPVEGHMVCEDHVEVSRGNVIQNVMPQKLVEQSFVGPSKIISQEMGQNARQGTHIVTVQQMIVTNKGNNKQQAMSSEVPTSHMPEDFNRKLSRFNSQSVKTVLLLSDPSPTNLQQVRTIADDLEVELSDIVKGVEALAQQQTSEEDKKRLLDELEELRKYLLTLASSAKRSDLKAPENVEKAEEAAKRMAELSAQFLLALDPRSRQRSALLRRSRKSFIADERVEATLRRASFLTLSSTASKAVEDSIDDLQQPYGGPTVTEDDAKKLQASAVDKLGKLNAAVALLLEARADPKNVDYETLMNTMKTMKELTPLLVQDAKALSSTKDGEVKRDLLDKIKALCESLNTLCTHTGVEKDSVLQDAANNYANTSGKLIYVFNPKARGGRNGPGIDPNKEAEIMNLVKEVGGRTSLLLTEVDKLIESAYSDPRSQPLDNARLKCGESAKRLHSCSQLVAPTIHEPHCQSAITSALENLSSSAQQVSQAWKPLTEEPDYHHHRKELDDRNIDLMKAIEKLKKASGDLNGDTDGSPDEEAVKAKEMKRLQFITNLSAAKLSMAELERELLAKGMEVKGKPIKDNHGNKAKLQLLLSQKISQLNAAMASLINSTSDNENVDYETAEAAINLINELTPEVIKDTKSLCPYEDEKTRRHMMEEITALCQATESVCASAENNNFNDLHEAASNFANSSGKLCYIFNPRANPDKENQIVDLSTSACQKASEMLSGVYRLAEAVGGGDGLKLDSAGTKVVEAAKALFVAAQITAPSIKDSRCQSTLIASADKVSELSQDLAAFWDPLVRKPEYQALGNKLNKDREIMEATLEKLRNACKPDDDIERVITEDPKASEKQRLKFIMTMTDAKKKLGDAERLLIDNSKDIPAVCDKLNKNSPEHKELQRVSAQKLAELNAAIAALVRATSDTENPDYKSAESSIATISKLTPEIIKNTNKLAQYMDEKQRRVMLDNCIRGLHKATTLICDSMDNNDFKELNDAANKFGNYSGNLYYVFNPRANVMKENQILDISKAACEKASEMLSLVYELAEKVGGESGSRLDSSGAKIVDAAQALLTTAQVTAPLISDSRCQAELLSSIDAVSDLNKKLVSEWQPLVQNSNHEALGNQISRDQEMLETVLETLRNVCRPDSDAFKNIEDDPKNVEKQRMKFIMRTAAAKKKMDEAEKLIHDHNSIRHVPVKLNNCSPEYKELQHRSAEKLTELNAAIAALIRATSDHENPDYKTAESVMLTISQLMPEIVQNTNKLCEYADEKERKMMLDNVRSLCKTNKLICDGVERKGFKELNNAAITFANSSGKLSYVFNPRGTSEAEDKILALSEEACKNTTGMLSRVHDLAERVGGEAQGRLVAAEARLCDAAHALRATAHIISPSIADSKCQSALLTSVDKVSNLTKELASEWEPVVRTPAYKSLESELNKDRHILEATLEKLRNACRSENDMSKKSEEDLPENEKQHLKVVMTTSAAKKRMNEADKVLQNHINNLAKIPVKRKESPEYKDLQQLSTQKLAEMNAAIAALVRATSDAKNPDYKATEIAIEELSHLTPVIVQNTCKICTYADEKQRQLLLEQARELCSANQLICDNIQENNFRELNNATNKFADSSAKLRYVFNPTTSHTKENQIKELSQAVVQKTSDMLSSVYTLAEAVGGADGCALDAAGAKAVDAAQALLTTTQLTASCIDEPKCRSMLVASANNLSSHTRELSDKWTPITQNSKYKTSGEELSKKQKELNTIIEKMIEACMDKPEVSRRPPKPEPPVRTKSLADYESIKANKHVQFCRSVDDAQSKIKSAEEDLANTQKSMSPLIISEQEKLQDLIQSNLALAGIAVSHLISDLNPHNMNYESAIKSTKVLAELVPEIVKVGKKIGDAKEEAAQKTFLADVLSLCQASNKLCDTAKNDPKNLDTVAVDFGNKASRVLYNACAEVDPSQEKDVVDRAREIGDSASRLVGRAGGAGGAGGEGGGETLGALGAAATSCADAARQLMYTAKLVAPTIHNEESQETLLDVSNRLFAKVKEFSQTWQPLSRNSDHVAFVQELDSEAGHLKHLLERFNHDLKNNTMVRRREVEKLVVQDTPLRQFASRILETAQAKAVFPGLSPEERKSFADYSSKLSAAIKDLDLANARSRNLPHDEHRREQLEEAVQRLQQTCLESRIQAGEEKRFVDLMDLINDVSADAKSVSEAASTVKPEYNKSALIVIKDETDDIVKEALEASKPSEVTDDRGDLDDVLIIKNFAQKCDEHINATKQAIEEIRDDKSKTMLLDKLTSLKRSSDLLTFAINSHISGVRNAALEVNHADFIELEKNIDNILQSTRRTKKTMDEMGSAGSLGAATSLCSAAASSRASQKLPLAVAAYLLEARAAACTDPDRNYKLEQHLKNLLQLLKTQNLVRSRRIATWQDEDDEETDDVTLRIIKEIETYNKKDSDGVQRRGDMQMINENDLTKLLFPSKNVVAYTTEKDLKQQFEQQVQKLSATGAATLPAAAARLAALARAFPTRDPIKKIRIEETSEAMCFKTYNLLKTAEAARKDPHNPDSQRRLHEAGRLLNESINKLRRAVASEDVLRRGCSEMQRDLQLQMRFLQRAYPASTASYAQCLEPLQNANNLQFLQTEGAMTREEFVSNLHLISSMVCHSAENAAQCGYLLSLPADQQHVAKEGFVNVPRLRNIVSDIRMASLKIIQCTNVEQANYSQSEINQHVVELQEVVQDALDSIKDPKLKTEVMSSLQELDDASKFLQEALRSPDDMQRVTSAATKLLDTAEDFNALTNLLSAIPAVEPSAECKARSDDVIKSAKTLIIKTQDLVKQVESSNQEVLKWEMFENDRNAVVKAYEDFVDSVRENGRRAGFIEYKGGEAKEEAPKKTFVQLQLDLANEWLTKPAAKPDVKSAGMQGVKNIIDLAEKVSEDMVGEEKLDMVGMVMETKELLEDCSSKYNSEKACLLLERLRELEKMLNWQVVNRVVEDFLEEEPLADLDILADVERDVEKRKYILNKKIAELLSQLGKVTRTVRLVADTGLGAPCKELTRTKDQAELLAPALVKAAQRRVEQPDNNEAVENYKALLAEYAESMSKIREMCDRSVDPMDFAQAAGETMQRIRNDFSVNDPHTCANTAKALNRLGLRVVEAGLRSQEVQRDPEMKRALAQAQRRLASRDSQRASRPRDWSDVAAEILRTTGQVESFLGGENIFQKQPEPDQPIYAAALGLHAAVREWSARDNAIVAAAKRMAVLMARLAAGVARDRKSELLSMSKSIVDSSHQVAALARKLALECTDMRIRTNLMQVCERIPTISGQLKMLITVKGSSLGHQGTEEDAEAMNTLVGNAQNLMLSIQEVVKAAIAASVKIMSQRGPRMKWVRRAYY